MKPIDPALRRTALIAVTAFAILCLLAWLVSHAWNSSRGLDAITESGTLRVLTRNTSSTYYNERDQPTGFEYDLVKMLADDLGVSLEIIVEDSIPGLLYRLQDNQADLVAAGITRTEDREQLFQFGPDYLGVQQQVVCHSAQVKSVEDLLTRHVVVIEGSSYEETLAQWKTQYPDLEWIASEQLSTEQILDSVSRKVADCTLADSNIVALNQRYYPNISVAFAASELQQLAWVLPDNSAPLQRYLQSWFVQLEKNGQLPRLLEKYYGHVQIYDHYDTRVFHRRIEQRLPRFRQHFLAAADKYDLPWTLLAAMAYQESHWDPKARSPTGVRGLMMLTQTTAKALKVKNRLDPEQSIFGGAEYLRQMLDRLPKSIDPDDRLSFALAAYNIGLGHIKDARELTIKLGKNARLWVDVKSVLPLLANKSYYKQLKHGYARGSEPVKYVDRIKNYQEILRKELTSNNEKAT
jgi:membrane-bound lytic murein transglycosylase F